MTGIADLVKKPPGKFYWDLVGWAYFVGHIFLWWTMWTSADPRWNFFFFSYYLLPSVVWSRLPQPKVESDVSIDLREYFYENHSAFFGVTAAFTALMSAQNWLLTGRMSPAPVTIVFAVWFALLCASAVIKNQRYHAATALLFILLFLLFVIRFGLRLGGM